MALFAEVKLIQLMSDFLISLPQQPLEGKIKKQKCLSFNTLKHYNVLFNQFFEFFIRIDETFSEEASSPLRLRKKLVFAYLLFDIIVRSAIRNNYS